MKRIALLTTVLTMILPLHALEITGDVDYCHDPSTIIYENGKYWCFSTAPNLNLRSSPDLVNWTWEPRAFHFDVGVPDYMVNYLVTCESGTEWNLWVPEIVKYQDLYYLYYSRNMCQDYNGTDAPFVAWRSAQVSKRMIGSTMAMYYGRPCISIIGGIDPTLLFDTTGNLWLAAGSFGYPMRMAMSMAAFGCINSTKKPAWSSPVPLPRRSPVPGLSAVPVLQKRLLLFFLQSAVLLFRHKQQVLHPLRREPPLRVHTMTRKASIFSPTITARSSTAANSMPVTIPMVHRVLNAAR